MKRSVSKGLIRMCAAILCAASLCAGAAASEPSALYEYAGVLGSDVGKTQPDYNLGNPVAISKDTYGYDSNGTLLETWGEMSNTPGNFFSPMGCDINRTTGRLYVTDGVLERVQFYDAVGTAQ